ncbi:MAG: preprotein translocase subunit SecY, partial [Candidatus Yanofskybacteria bacterium]|nr:preprotein translocase subunit SecY [Candidatus Yanofskybacteria bacterium]
MAIRILQVFKRPELRTKVFFILALLAVSRLIAHIPIPAIDASRLREFLAQNQFFGLISAFTGGSLSTLSIAMLGLSPYITASIIMQLLTIIFPRLEQMYKSEGEAGRAKFNQYSRILTVPLAAVQGYGFLTLLARQGVIDPLSLFGWASTLVVIVAGSMFMMWL